MDRLEEKQLEIDRLRGLLARLEWADSFTCPACHAAKHNEPHYPGCWLAAELPAEPAGPEG